MGRKIVFNLLEGTGTALAPANGWLSIRPTNEYANGNFLVVATTTEERVRNGMVTFPDVQPTPVMDPNSGKYPWAYIVRYRDDNGYSKSWNVLVPTGTGDLQGSQLVQVVPDGVHYNIMQGPAGPAGDGLHVYGAYPTFAALQAANPHPKRGDSFLVGSKLYVWDGTSWGASSDLQGAKGDKGDKGATGERGATGLTGEKGDTGVTPNINAIANTGAPGSTVVVAQSGTPEAPVLAFTIPRGDPGLQGPQGEKGDPGEKGDTGDIGAGVPIGGVENQVIASTGTGSSVWVNATDLPNVATATSVTDGDATTLDAAKTYADSVRPKSVDLISKLRAPIVISHRGGSSVFPEHSMDGYIASINSGFLPEQDIQFLSDGTPVCIHDTTLNRTTTGTGNVSSTSLATWKSLEILNPVAGGKTSTTVTFEEALDRLGGTTVMVPEIKSGATNAQADACIQMVKDRNLDRSVLFQSFDYAIAKRVAAAGLECVYLLSNTLPTQTPATMLADGIKWAGPSTAMSTANITTLVNGGIKVMPYTLKTRAQVKALPSNISGYFSDDPWWNANQLQADTVPRWESGNAWPMGRIFGTKVGGTATDIVDWSSWFNIEGNSLRFAGMTSATAVAGTPALVTVDLGHLIGGTINRPAYVEFTVTFGRHAKGETTGVGATIWRNSSNSEAFFADAAYAGQEAFTFQARRNGQMQGWSYTAGADAVSLGTAVMGTPVPTNATFNTRTVRFRLELGTSWIAFFNLTDNVAFTASMAKTGPFNVGLRFNGTEATISDVRAGAYIER